MSDSLRDALFGLKGAAQAFQDHEGNMPAKTGEFVGLENALLAAERALMEDEVAILTRVALRITGNTHPEESSMLGVAYAIGRHLNFPWPSAKDQLQEQDEELISSLYTSFVDAVSKNPEDLEGLFKSRMRLYHLSVNAASFPSGPRN